jgi:hypothetical protein
LIDRIRQRIRENTTPRHVPAKVLQVADIPRTKSGKIVELAVRNVVHGRPVKNLEALANPEALESFLAEPLVFLVGRLRGIWHSQIRRVKKGSRSSQLNGFFDHGRIYLAAAP